MPILNSSPPQSLLVIAGIGILIWLMVRGKLGRRRLKREVFDTKLRFNSNAKASPETYTGTKSLGAPSEVLKWQVELHDLGRELKGELDSKMLAVGNVTRSYRQAEQRLSELIKMADEAARSEPSSSDSHSTSSSRVVMGSEPPATTSLYSKVHHLQAVGWSDSKISGVVGLSTADVRELLRA